MPIFMHDEGLDRDVMRGAERGFATGETLVHVEASGGGFNGMILDDTAGDPSNLELMVKVLDGPLPAHGHSLIHVEADVGWML